MLKSKGLDVEQVRKDFPILGRKVHGDKKLVYLDNAATSQKPKKVIDALVDYYERYNSNVHRSVHQLGEEATEAYEDARKKAAAFVNCGASEVVFTRGTTESINLLRFAWGEAAVKKGDLIVLTLMEHHSNIVPWQLLAKRNGARVEYAGLTSDGKIDYASLEKLLAQSPRLVAFTQCSNVLGTVNDARRVCEMARRAGAVSVVDGAQSVPHMPVDATQMGCDFLAFSGHKMLGPTGIGVLYGRKRLLEEMGPFQGGGEMIREVTTEGATWNEVPHKFEAGTVNIADAIGLGVAMDYLTALGMARVRDHEARLLDYAFKVLGPVPGMKIYGPAGSGERGGVISFNLGDVHPHDLATILDEEGIAIRSGHHCAQPLMRWLDVPATSRASFHVYNTEREVDALRAGLEKAREVFKL